MRECSTKNDDGETLKSSFNGGMLMSHADRILRLSLLWKRMGGFDYGIYLASDPKPVAFIFRVMYDHDGKIVSFVVGEITSSSGMGWEEEHAFLGSPPPITCEESELLMDLSDKICLEWLQSSGKDEWRSIMSQMGLPNAVYDERGLDDFLSSGLPFQISKKSSVDFLSVAVPAENDCFFAVFSDGSLDVAEIEKRLYQFADLI